MIVAEFRQRFLDQVREMALQGDVYPVPCHLLTRDGKLSVLSLPLNGHEALEYVRKQLLVDVVGVACGVDRFTRPDQGCKHSSAFTYTIAIGGRVTHGFVDYEPGQLVEAPCEDTQAVMTVFQRENWEYLMQRVWCWRV